MYRCLPSRVLLAVALCTILASFVTAQEPCTQAERHTAMTAVFQDLKLRITSDLTLAAVFLRAAFHDCITATSDDADSGCNGSLQFELSRRGNSRLERFITTLSTSRATVTNGTCVSVADGIQIGMAAGLSVVGDISFDDTDLWDARVPRRDATKADSDGQLPSGRFNYDQVVQFYALKGFSEEDAIVSTAGGHAIGGFGLPFVPGTKFTTLYAENLVNRTKLGVRNAPGFHTLPSDSALIRDENGVRVLKEVSGFNEEFEENGDEAKFDRAKGMDVLVEKFVGFLTRNSRLSGTTVGNSNLLDTPRTR